MSGGAVYNQSANPDFGKELYAFSFADHPTARRDGFGAYVEHVRGISPNRSP
jgi:hypothetical protein